MQGSTDGAGKIAGLLYRAAQVLFPATEVGVIFQRR